MYMSINGVTILHLVESCSGRLVPNLCTPVLAGGV